MFEKVHIPRIAVLQQFGKETLTGWDRFEGTSSSYGRNFVHGGDVVSVLVHNYVAKTLLSIVSIVDTGNRQISYFAVAGVFQVIRDKNVRTVVW